MGIKKDGFNIDFIKYGSYNIDSLFFGSDLIWKKKSSNNLRLIFSDTFNRADSTITTNTKPDIGTYYSSRYSRIVSQAYSPASGTQGSLSVKINIPFIISAETQGANKNIGIYNIAYQHSSQSVPSGLTVFFFVINHIAYFRRIGRTENLFTYTIPVKDRKPIYTMSIKVESDFSYFYLDDKLIYTDTTASGHLPQSNTGIYHRNCYGVGWLDNLQIWEYDEV